MYNGRIPAMASCHFGLTAVNQRLSEQLIDMIVNDIAEDMDRRTLDVIDEIVKPATDFIATIRLSGDRKLVIEQVCLDSSYFFTIKNRKTRKVIEDVYAMSLFEGVEECMSMLEDEDSDKLW